MTLSFQFFIGVNDSLDLLEIPIVLGEELRDEDPLAGGETGGVLGRDLVNTLQLGGGADGNLK